MIKITCKTCGSPVDRKDILCKGCGKKLRRVSTIKEVVHDGRVKKGFKTGCFFLAAPLTVGGIALLLFVILSIGYFVISIRYNGGVFK